MSLWFQESENFRRGNDCGPIAGEAAFVACHAVGLSPHGRSVVNALSDRMAARRREAGRIFQP